jgi:hypothetical protein
METFLADILIGGSQFVIGLLPFRSETDVRYLVGIELNFDEAPSMFHLFYMKIG